MTKENNPKKIIKMIDIVPSVSQAEPFLKKEELKPEPIELEQIEPEAIEPEEIEQFFPQDLFVSKVKKINKKKILIAIGAVCIIVLAIIGYFNLSKAEIVIKPKTETMQFKTVLNIDKSAAFIDSQANKIPAQLFQVEKEAEREFPATQEKDVKTKAKGVITIYNQYSSAPQTLVKATRFISDKGLIFRTTQTIVIPGAKIEEGKIIASTIDVQVEAAEVGKDYNIGPSSFTIPGFEGTAKYTGFYGKSSAAMAGGAIGKMKVVSAEDIGGAKDILAVELKGEVESELEKSISSDLKTLKDTTLIEVADSSSSVGADQPAEKFKVKVKVTGKILGFNEKDAISLINSNLENKIAKDKTISPNSIEINYTVTDINLNKGIAKLACDVKEMIASKIDTEEVKKSLIGKNETEVRQYLSSRADIESAKVIFWPFWVKKVPTKESKVKVTID